MTNTTAYDVAVGLPLSPSVRESLAPDVGPALRVAAFHETYRVPIKYDCVDERFAHMTNARVGFRLGLIVEEMKELFKDGFGINVSVSFDSWDGERGTWARFNDAALNQGKPLDHAEANGRLRNGVKVADALGDLVYVIYGMAHELGYDLSKVLQEIHASNLTKMGDDGQPIYRDDGKVLKGPNYVMPNIRAALGIDAD